MLNNEKLIEKRRETSCPSCTGSQSTRLIDLVLNAVFGPNIASLTKLMNLFLYEFGLFKQR